MKYLCWVYDATEPNLLAGLEMYIPWWPDDAQHQAEYQWVAVYNNSLLRTFISGQILGLKGASGYDVGCDCIINGTYYGIIRIISMFDSLTLANSSGKAYVSSAAHTKGYNDDGTGWRALTWKMG